MIPPDDIQLQFVLTRTKTLEEIYLLYNKYKKSSSLILNIDFFPLWHLLIFGLFLFIFLYF